MLASAGVAAFVSGMIALVGQWLERSSRRRELLLAKAIDLSVDRSRFLADLAESYRDRGQCDADRGLLSVATSPYSARCVTIRGAGYRRIIAFPQC